MKPAEQEFWMSTELVSCCFSFLFLSDYNFTSVTCEKSAFSLPDITGFLGPLVPPVEMLDHEESTVLLVRKV